MSIRTATPYFILNGKADQALEFYQQALRATVEARTRFGDIDGSCSIAQRDKVMHAELRAGQARLMLSDGPGEGPLPETGVVSVALELDDGAEMRRCFDALSVSGKVIQPIFDSPWGTLFGVVTDRFGVSWMLDCKKA